MSLFLIAAMADRTVAISTDQVESVVDIGEVTPVPGVAPQVRGLAALRSRVVTVISSRTAFGVSTGLSVACRAVLTAVDGHLYAILVNELADVEDRVLQPLTDGLALTGLWREAAVGLIDHDGEPILAIDLRMLIPRLECAA